MQKQFYFLSPVEAVKVTKNNLEEVAEWCGGKVAQAESRRTPGVMDSYVWVPTPQNTVISWAFPGMYITKRLVRTMKGELRATFAVFRRDYFEKNYYDNPMAAVDDTWEKENRALPKAERKEKVMGNIFDENEAKEAPKPQPPKSEREKLKEKLERETGLPNTAAAIVENIEKEILRDAVAAEAEQDTAVFEVEDFDGETTVKPGLVHATPGCFD